MTRQRSFLSNKQIWLILTPILVGLLIVVLYFIPGTGFGSYIDAGGNIVPRKTLWDWLSLAIVPAFLAVGGLWLNSSIQRGERERADDQLKEQALQTYLDRMSELLLSGQFEKEETKEKARTVARARTLTLLRGLDGERKGAVLRFLYESGLISGGTPKVDLRTADFSDAILRGTPTFEEINLKETHFENADMTDLFLEGANFEGAQLKRASLKHSHLQDANFEFANLIDANLEDAKFLSARLKFAKLKRANLTDANFEGANLEGADLTGASITQEQLDSAILSVHTILPDGSLNKLVH